MIQRRSGVQEVRIQEVRIQKIRIFCPPELLISF